jgi:hypothetical protein
MERAHVVEVGGPQLVEQRVGEADRLAVSLRKGAWSPAINGQAKLVPARSISLYAPW